MAATALHSIELLILVSGEVGGIQNHRLGCGGQAEKETFS
jgi:hypothetical protein